MSNNKQSSVEWLYEKMFVNHGRITIEEFQQAKAMHKEEITNAHGSKYDYSYSQIDPKKITGDQYYNETFGGNNEQQSIPTITLKKIERIDTRDVLYDIKLKQFCVYPKDIDLKTVDIVYIKKNCLKLSIIPNN